MVCFSRRSPIPTIMIPSWAVVAEVLGLVPEKWVAFSTLVFPPLAFPARLVGRGVLFFPTILALLSAPLGRGIILETVLDGRGLVSLKWVIISTPLILPAVRFLITYPPLIYTMVLLRFSFTGKLHITMTIVCPMFMLMAQVILAQVLLLMILEACLMWNFRIIVLIILIMFVRAVFKFVARLFLFIF